MRAFMLGYVAACIGLSLVPTSAFACMVVVTHQPSPAEKRREAQRLIDSATAIVDGEVVRPLNGSEPARIRVARVLKGGNREFVLVGERTSCDIALTQKGDRLRLILVGGPDVFFLPTDYSYAVEEDRLLGSDRRRDWPFYQANNRPTAR